MKVFITIPSVMRSFMENPEVRLSALDRYMFPNPDGQAFHYYSMKVIKKLEAAGIKSFTDLKAEYDKCQAKTSGLSSSLRIMVQGHYTMYVNEYEKSLNHYNSLSDEIKNQEAIDGYLVEEVENPNGMKLNLINISQSLTSNGEALIKKDALVADMDVIRDHYNGSNEIPEQLKECLENYEPITFGQKYLSMLLNRQLTLTEDGDNVRINA